MTSGEERGASPGATAAAPSDLVLLLPLYEDWTALAALVAEIDRVLGAAGMTATAVVVDDGSAEPPPPALPALAHVATIEVVRLRRNLGHQRAIAVGLAHVSERPLPEAIVVMDSDGEDRPTDIPRLIACMREHGNRRIVFAERTKRFEPLWFRWLYALYRHLHRLLTGIPVRVGNFSAMPGAMLPSVVSLSELWSHYAAAVFKARVPRASLPTTRGRRLAGHGKMDFFGLVNHGFTALAVFAETVGIRLLTLASAAFAAALLVFVALVVVPGSAAPSVVRVAVLALAVVGTMQMTMVAAATLFLVLYMRDRYSFIPTRDHHVFIERVWTLPRAGSPVGADASTSTR